MITVLGLDWSSGAPLVRIRETSARTSRLIPLLDRGAVFETVPDARVCVGTVDRSGDEPVYVDCDATPVPGGRWCERCRTVEQVLAASFHQSHHLGRGAIDPRVARRLEQPHRLYVAAFRDGSLKVGTTAGASGGHRLLEQGAWRARYVALLADGFDVRVVEDAVTEQLGVAQAVSVGRKLDGLVRPAPDAELVAELSGLAERVRSVRTQVDVEWLDDEWVSPCAAEDVWTSVHRYPHDVLDGTHDLRAVGACGRIVAVELGGGRGGDVFVLDLGRLFGRVLREGDPDAASDVFVQDALF